MHRMSLHLSLQRFRRRPPRPAHADLSAEEAEPGQAGWYVSSFELRQGLDVTELDAGLLAGVDAWAAPEGASSQA